MPPIKSAPYQCRLCHRRYSSPALRKKHEQRYHNADRSPCPYCHRWQRGGEGGLRNHIRMVHTPEKCGSCSGIFCDASKHTCAADKQHVCNVCRRVYKTVKACAAHAEFCALNVRSACNRSFSSERTAKAHVCSVCPLGWYDETL